MSFELPELPFAKDALAPHMSEETLNYHYGKHHAGYVKKLNAGVEGTQWAGKSLEEIIRGAEGGVFNNAAQVWNHTFFWNCLKPGGGGEPSGDLAKAIDAAFGSYADFKTKFSAACAGQFGSGWGWLVKGQDGLEIMTTGNADTPLKHGKTAVLTIDVWEHAYYIDYRNDRAKFIGTILDSLVNWDFAASQL
ncbi:Superoxide dismutase [Enhygromyxa salina]|uniref:Superoxide dismutase n=1 Tax=Enhygromyxa salina TaxID=215803 RepID=A0A2S9XB10_9BACT|nr:Fe-Mn family superoxide dismutase [Enhygromyxa salina]PRP90039.1 Superoxide dismutase [Enhygromyxa salina]